MSDEVDTAQEDEVMAATGSETAPWYRRCVRWGQTNLVEIDPLRYDDAFWRRYWADTRIHGIIVNAGGIVTYYPSALPLRRRAFGIDQGIDLFGRISESARQSGLALVARMDSNRVHEEFADAHPDWLAVDELADGSAELRRDGVRGVACRWSPPRRRRVPHVQRRHRRTVARSLAGGRSR